MSQPLPKPQPWDPETLLELNNVEKPGICCVGTAFSLRRRCLNVLAETRINAAMEVIESLSRLGPNDGAIMVREQLERLVKHLLCGIKTHEAQASSIVNVWLGKVLDHFSERTPQAGLLDNKAALGKDIYYPTAWPEFQALRRDNEMLKAALVRSELANKQLQQRQSEVDAFRQDAEESRNRLEADLQAAREAEALLQDEVGRLRQEKEAIELAREQRLLEEQRGREQRRRQDEMDREDRLGQEERAREQRTREEVQAREQRQRQDDEAREQSFHEEQQGREHRLREEEAAARIRHQIRREEAESTARHRESLLRDEISARLREQEEHLRRRGEALRAEEEALEREAEATRHRDDARRAEDAARQRDAEADQQREEAERRRSAAERAENQAIDARIRAEALSRSPTDITTTTFAQQLDPIRQTDARFRQHQHREREEYEHRRQEQSEWTASWMRYETDWTNIFRLDRASLNENVWDSLPWPVKDGQWQAVNEANVNNFLTHVQPLGRSEDRTWFSRMLRRQALRWREDYVVRLYPRAVGDERLLRLVGLVAGVIERLKGSA